MGTRIHLINRERIRAHCNRCGEANAAIRVEVLALSNSVAILEDVRVFWKSRPATNGSGERRLLIDPDAKPDFLCVGAQKAGTTWLFEQLNWHDDFWMPPLKEVNYFDHMSRSRHPERSARSNLRLRDERDRRFLEAMENLCAQQHIDLDLYAQLFAPKGSLLSGDVSPAYCIVPEEIIVRIVDRFPELKVIFLARDPVERAWSDLSMAVQYGGVRSFDTNDTAAVMRNLFHPDMITRSFQSCDRGALAARISRMINFAFIFSTICKAIPNKPGARSCVFSAAIRTNQAAR